MGRQREKGNEQMARSSWTADIKEGFLNDLGFKLAFEKGARVRSQPTC